MDALVWIGSYTAFRSTASILPVELLCLLRYYVIWFYWMSWCGTGVHIHHFIGSWNYLSSIGSGITLICWLYLQLARVP